MTLLAPRTAGAVPRPDEPRPAASTRAPVRAARPPARPRLVSEVALLAVGYLLYELIRFVATSGPAAATSNGRQVLYLEALLRVDVERSVNAWVTPLPALALPADYAYATLHYAVTPAVLVWLALRHPDRYRPARTVLLASTAVALLGYWLLPTAPPRLLPDGGFTDTMAQWAGYGWWGSEGSAPRGVGTLTNQNAAMPSMHVGWAVWCAVQLRGAPRLRRVAWAYPVLVVLVVVATGNHYLLDALAGAGLVAVVHLTVRRLLHRWRADDAVAADRLVPPPVAPGGGR